jgi:hypothetical protein
MSDPKEAHIFVGVTVHDRDETARIVRILRRSGFGTLDLSDDEVAKGHMRHMVGGHSALAKNELLYRFEFPERRGALMRFLSAMNPGWNISLFNYRNLGADYGSILIGMQVPREEMGDFRKFLQRLGYPHATRRATRRTGCSSADVVETLFMPDRCTSTWSAHSVRETAVQRALRAATAGIPGAGMQIAPEQGALDAGAGPTDRREALSRDRHVHRLLGALRRARDAGERPARLLRPE